MGLGLGGLNFSPNPTTLRFLLILSYSLLLLSILSHTLSLPHTTVSTLFQESFEIPKATAVRRTLSVIYKVGNPFTARIVYLSGV